MQDRAMKPHVVILGAGFAGLEIAALCAQLARRGSVDAIERSAVAAPGARTGGSRRAPGEDVELTIVMPTQDAAGDRVRRCVAAAQATTEAPHEIVIVDNGAPPQGFTAPVNAGLRAARGRYAVVLNDDVELLPGWWPPLRAALDAGAAVVFPMTIDGAMRTDFAAWCFALTRETLDTFGVQDGEFLDPELVVWYQDTDLLQRLREAGRPPALVEASTIRHGLSETVGSEDPQLRAWVVTQVKDDQAAFERKHGTAVAGAAR
jgi:glycosyltransferase involved in cell wall biosynthesis